MPDGVALVALPLRLRKLLSYRIPGELVDLLQPGHRVRIPLKSRTTHGYVLECLSAQEAPPVAGSLKPILDIQPRDPLLEGALLRLARWVAEYYVCPVGEVLEAALPAQVWRGRPRRLRAGSREPERDGPELPLQLTPHQTESLAAILDSLAEAVPDAAGVSREDVARSRKDAPALGEGHSAAPGGDPASGPAPVGGDGAERRAPPIFLLHGVTGSGKTEVYLHAVERLLAQGRSALVLVPEIAMGTQLVQRFRRRLGPQVGIFHSGMPAGERRLTWWRARDGEVRVVVGARSAVFVPLRDLGAVIVDEEHESAYKQAESPRYHGRDVALMRARMEGVPAVLGSATPSLESRHNVDLGKYRLLRLPERVEQRPAARVALADLRARRDGDPVSPAETASRVEVVSQPRLPGQAVSGLLLDHLRFCLQRQEQSIVFLNRRGHSTSVQCEGCGHVFRCANCSVILTYHRQGGVLRCHYCGHASAEARACPECGGREFLYGGFGTQKVESQLRRHLPDARIVRMDLDTTRRRGAHQQIIRACERGEIDILVGTQMVGKGLDFPGVTLVGVLLAEREMAIPDFRSQERAFQILTQVAGRAGRGRRAGAVIFQTYMPEHFVIQAAALQDYETFYRSEIEERRALDFPPFTRQVHLLLDDPGEEKVMRAARALREHLEAWMRSRRVSGVTLFGPAPMPIERLKGRYRWHLTLRSRAVKPLRPVLHETLNWDQSQRRGRVRLIVDVDPLHGL